MKNIFLLFVLFATSTSSLYCQDTDFEWQVRDTTLFAVEYPSTWKLDESGQYGTTFTISSPRDIEEDQFSENLNLTIQDLTGYNLSFEAYVDISIEQIENMMENSVITINETLTAKDRKYHKVVYTSTQGALHLQFDQYFWVIGNEAYLLTFSGESAKAEDYKIIRERMLTSFLLK